jgi:deoxyribonuclease IV
MNNLKNKREIGLHLRIENSYSELAEIGIQLGASSLQFFLMPKNLNKYLKVKNEDQKKFLDLSDKFFSNSYIHSSYWIAPANGKKTSARVSERYLKKEIAIAKKLNLNTIVLHAGAASGFPFNKEEPNNRTAGINSVANIINSVLKKENNITILIENTAHGNKIVCSDLQDFTKLKPLLNFPKQVGFCLDLAHAYAYGYEMQDTDKFINLLDQTMGTENIKLIHLNDSAKKLNSKLDKHALIGDGFIGKQNLKNIVNHKTLKHIPLILEPPEMDSDKIKKMISEVQSW